MSSKLNSMIAVLVMLMLSACGGGTGGGTFTAGGGIGGSGVTVGSTSSFGSIFVNDIEFDTTAAVVVVDGVEQGTGDQAVLDNIAVGKVVRIEGPSESGGTGTANRVVYNEDVIGPVESVTVIDANTQELVVLGQTVVVDSTTNIVNTTLASIAAGHLVEISGFRDEVGTIEATYLRKIADTYTPGTEVQVRGFASGINTTLKTFDVSQLTINYAAVDVSRLTSGNPSTGQYVEVKGVLSGSTLNAVLVEPEDILGVDNADNAEFTGIITEFMSISDFFLSGISIQTDGATVYTDLLPEEIGFGSKLTVRGSLTNRVILADSIRAASALKIEGDVQTTPTPGSVTGVLTVAGLDGLSLKVTILTKILGDASSLSEIEEGDHIIAFGKSLPEATAEKLIVKKTPKKQVSLKGPVAEVSPSVTVLGVDIDSLTIPPDAFFVNGIGPFARDDFFSQTEIGDIVNLKGSYGNGGETEWLTVELQKAD